MELKMGDGGINMSSTWVTRTDGSSFENFDSWAERIQFWCAVALHIAFLIGIICLIIFMIVCTFALAGSI